MKRTAWKTLGYDCRNAPCKHEPKGDHGISGGRWNYAVTTDEGDLALLLEIHADEYPETVPQRKAWSERTRREATAPPSPAGWISGPLAHLSVHATFPTDIESCEARGSLDCKLVRPCFIVADFCSDDAARLWRGSGQPWQYEPTERLWRALEERLAEVAPGLRAKNVRGKWVKCPKCGGGDHPGFVEVK